MDQQQWKERRQQREEQRQLRRKRQRILAGVIAAVVILIACGVVIFVLSRNASRTPPVSTEPVQTTPVSTGTTPTGGTETPTEGTTGLSTEPFTAATQPAEGTTVVYFGAAGDLNVNDQTVASGGPYYDYTTAFKDVVELLSRPDLTVLNFEGNACGAPYGTQSVSAPQTMLEALKRAGVDLLQAANSCTISNGVLGLDNTLQNIRAAGLEPVGAQTSGKNYTIRVVNGVKIAVVAFTKGMNSMALPAGSEGYVNLLYTDYASTYQKVDTDGINKTLQAIEKEKPDITIALLHWGSEFNDKRSGTQKTIKDLMIAGGVDVILGTHPHYVQSIETEAGGQLVFYSLGDFYSNVERSGTEYSLFVELQITKDHATGLTTVTSYTYTPLYTELRADGTLRVLRMQEAMEAFEQNDIDRVSQETYDSMVYALERIKVRIQPVKEEKEE